MARRTSPRKSGDARSETSQVARGVPAYQIRNTAVDGRYRIEKEVLTDPWRDVVLQRVRFVPLQGTLADFRLYALLAPHLANRGSGNTAWVGDYKGDADAPRRARQLRVGLGVLGSVARPIGRVRRRIRRMAGIAGRQTTHRGPTCGAENGNVAVTGEVDLGASDGVFVLALGFGPTAMEAGQHARISLLENFDKTKAAYVAGWKAWHKTIRSSTAPKGSRRSLYHLSAAVLQTHESKRVEGGVIASLSIPWGFSKGDDDLGGYHLTWPRDLVETAGGFLAVGARHAARRVLRYLEVTQEPDGHWSQNMWLDGTPYWHGIQMDETAPADSPGGSRRARRRD